MQVEKSAQKLEESVMQVLYYTFAWTFNTMCVTHPSGPLCVPPKFLR